MLSMREALVEAAHSTGSPEVVECVEKAWIFGDGIHIDWNASVPIESINEFHRLMMNRLWQEISYANA